MNNHSIAPDATDMLDNLQRPNAALGAAQCAGQHPSSNSFEILAPAAPQPERWANIPAALRDRPQWVLAGTDKRPLTADGRAASSTNPNTWTDFDTACRAAATKGLHIGYMLHESDPFACIDLDVKDGTPQEYIERFQKIVATFDSYTERSRSGRGLHVWVEGKIGKGMKRDGVEVYSQERLIICTGDTYIDRPVAQRQELLGKIASEMRPSASAEIQLDGDDAPDWSLAAYAAEDSGELGRLFAGDWQGRYPSQSEADLALIKLLLPHADSSRECWLTFRLSKLGERDKAGRIDYARSTMSEATQHLANDAAQVQHGQQIAESLFWRDFTQRGNPRHFRLLLDDDLAQLPSLRWLVKQIIPDAGIGAIYGDSGTYKSFLTLDLLAHIANGQEWFGRKVIAAPAVYVPFEGQGGIPARVAAWRIAQARRRNPDALLIASPGNERSNVAVIMEPMNLREQAHRDKLVQTLTECGWAGGVLCIDTLAHAANGIDENSSEMGEMIGIFRELQHRLGGVILIIHHSGKSQERGMRGWSGLHAAMDFVIECQRDKKDSKTEAKFVLTKVKDGSDGLSFAFAMQPVTLGMDDDGDEISSLIVSPITNEGQSVGSAKQTKKGINAIGAETAAADDKFIYQWVSNEVINGRFPSKNSIKGQLPDMKETYEITQDRVAAAVERLIAEELLTIERELKSPNGNVWIRPIDPPQVAK